MNDFANDLTALGQFMAGLGGLGGIAALVQIVYKIVKGGKGNDATKDKTDDNKAIETASERKTESLQAIHNNNTMNNRKRWVRILIFVSIALTAFGLLAMKLSQITARSDVSTRFAIIPPSGSGGSDTTEPISGVVGGLRNPSEYKVVIYAYGDHWYVQPDTSQKFTYIGPTGDWINQTHLGLRYAIVVVKKDFFDLPNETTNIPSVGDNIIATDSVKGK